MYHQAKVEEGERLQETAVRQARADPGEIEGAVTTPALWRKVAREKQWYRAFLVFSTSL